MGILRNVERIFVSLVGALRDVLGQSDRRVLIRAHVHDFVVALVLYGATLVEFLDGVVGIYEILAGAGLVAQAPDAHRGVVHGGVHHFEVARHVLVAELRHMAQRFFFVVVFVALEVGLIFEVDAIFVGQVVPIGVVAVVAVAHMVDVCALHQHDFALHLFARDGVSALGAGLVAVNALHFDGLAVEIIVTSRLAELIVGCGRFFDLDFAETHHGREGFEHTSFGVFQLTHEHIAPGSFGTPLLDERTRLEHDFGIRFSVLVHGNGHRSLRAFHGRSGFAVEGFLVEFVVHAQAFDILLGEVGHRGGDVERSVHQVGIEVGNGHHVAHLYLRFRREGDGAEDTREAEHVLAFEERAIAVAIDLNGHRVLAFHEIGRDIERSEVARVFRETHITAVDIEVEERIDAVEVEIHLTSVPFGGHGEGATIGTHFVAVLEGGPVFARFAHHAAFPVTDSYLVLENHPLVGVDRCAVFLRTVLLNADHVPVHGHLHLVPARNVVVGLVEISGALTGVAHPVEAPFAVEAFPIGGRFGQDVEGLLFVGKREEPRVRALFVERGHRRIFPLFAGRCRHVAVVTESGHRAIVGLCCTAREHCRQQERVSDFSIHVKWELSIRVIGANIGKKNDFLSLYMGAF